MARKFFNIFAIVALLSTAAATGVVRIDLERKSFHHLDNIQLEDKMDSNLIIDSPIKVEEDVMIGSEELNYSQLREIQRRHTARQLRQEQVVNLAQ